MIKKFTKAAHRPLLHLNSQTSKIKHFLIAHQRLLNQTFQII